LELKLQQIKVELSRRLSKMGLQVTNQL